MELLYLYGIVREARPLPAALETRLQLVSHGRLSALVEPVADEEFSPGVLDDKLQSLEWVAAQASRHQAVLEQVMRERPVVPARLCTMFSGPSALQAQLGEQEQRFHALLDALEGREEWSVKVFCQRAMLERDIATREGLDHDVGAPAAPGLAFLYHKRRRAELLRLVDAAIDDCVDDVLEHVEGLAFATRLRSLLSEQTTGREDAMMLNVAALLDHGADEVLAGELDEVSEHHGGRISIELRGPWPAYSFCNEPPAPTASGQGGLHAGPQ
jgi:Gas vesicle synthesis protein GvpL/GvpF